MLSPEREQEIRELFDPNGTYRAGFAAMATGRELLAALDQARAERDDERTGRHMAEEERERLRAERDGLAADLLDAERQLRAEHAELARLRAVADQLAEACAWMLDEHDYGGTENPLARVEKSLAAYRKEQKP